MKESQSSATVVHGNPLPTFIRALWIFFLTWILWAARPSTGATPPSEGDVAIPGSVRIDIEPPEAVADGASWSLGDGIDQAPGATVGGLFPGPRTATFQDLPGWREPERRDILVMGGKETRVTATYRPLPSFHFKAIPEQTARPGRAVEFVVTTDDPLDPQNQGPGANLVLAVDPPPAGAIDFDDASGRVRYLADPADRLPISLTFTADNGATGSTLITPIQDRVAEDSIIEFVRPLPDPESRDFATVSEQERPAKVFNSLSQAVYAIDISGSTLVFAHGHSSRLIEIIDGRQNVEELNLYADRIIIRDPLALPQTRIRIHARELHFEDDGLIDTTPLNRVIEAEAATYENGKLRGDDGAPGHAGGDIDVLVERFHAGTGVPHRFIMNGGHGGPAGLGRNGKLNEDLQFAIGSTAWHTLMNKRGIVTCGQIDNKGILHHEEVWNIDVDPLTCGRKRVPKAEDGVPAGRPGQGGRGGVLRSTVDLAGWFVAEGGMAGAPGGTYAGGTFGRKFAYVRVSNTVKPSGDIIVAQSVTTVTSVPGNSVTSPVGSHGGDGRFEFVDDAGAWLHSFSLRAVIGLAKEMYLQGHTDETATLLGEYRDILAAFQPAEPPGDDETDPAFLERVNLDQVQLEIETILHRLASNLDYFGNPAGWVPMLSFEANLLAFENEVEQSIPILYLAHWLRHAAENLEDAQGAAIEAKQSLEGELEDMIAAFNQAQQDIPRLQIEAAAIQEKIAQTKGKIGVRLQELLDEAQQNVEQRHQVPFWKKAAGVLSVACDLVPVGQPLVGRIGNGLGLLAQFDPDKPLESAASLTPKAFETFSAKNISFCFEGGKTNATATSTNAPKDARKEKINQLTECGKFLGEELKGLAGIFKEVQVDKEELKAEFEKLKAQDFVIKQLTLEVEELNGQKEQFAQQLAAAIQTVAGFSSAMTENLIGTHELEEQLAAGLAALNHGALLHIEEMERRAQDRLLEYQYFLAKAFQYRRLQPYTGNLDLNDLFQRFRTLVEAGEDHILSPAEFENLKFVYVDELREIVAEMFDNFNAPERSAPSSFKLTDAELEELNTQGRVIINLQERGLLTGNRENIRLADLRARDISVSPAGGEMGTHALTLLNFEHLGESRLTSAGRTLLFRHYQTETVNPIAWNAVYDGLLDSLSNSVLSPAAQSLIAVLLDMEPTTDSSLLLYSRPAAWADILITKEVQTDNGIDMVIDDLHIEVQFDFYNTSGNQRELAVEVTDDLAPVILVSHLDLNGRRDGQGDFTRVFSPFSQVTLEAPPSYGQFVFDGWVINGQPVSSSATTVLVNLTSGTKAQARFRPLELGGAEPVILQGPSGLSVVAGETASFSVHASGDEPMTYQWRRDGVPLVDEGRISGATTAQLMIASAQSDDAGAYTVTVANASGSVASSEAALTVTALNLSPMAMQGAQIGFTFATMAGREYTVEHTPRLENAEWTTVEVRTGTGETMAFVRELAEGSIGFFRLRVGANAGGN